MLPIFTGFLTVCIAYLLINFIIILSSNLANEFAKKSKKKNLFSKIISFLHCFFLSVVSLVNTFASLKFLTFFLITVLIFITFSLIPYLQNLNDEAMVLKQEKNIELYEAYSEEYAESAQRQIEEFQKMQSEMAARATSQQLQFWSLQQDEVGNALTEQIREFRVSIRNAELNINERKARIEARLSNKWYFFLED